MDMRVAADASGSAGQPWTLPESWTWVALRDVGSWTSGGTPKSTEPGYYNGPISWFRITDLNEGRLRRSEKSLTIRGLQQSSAKLIEAPFLMFAMYGASIGKMAISEIDASTNQAIACCSPSEAANTDFLFLALQRSKKSIVALGQGGAQPNISQRILLDFRVPLAPLPEQRRIVERIESLFAEIAEGEAALEDARKGLETFRRALLKSAVTGELTRDWRENNQPKKSGHDLLARIKAEHNATSAKGRGKRAASSPPLEVSDLPELPDGWAWARVDDLVDFVTSGSRGWSEYYADSGVMFVRAQNINSGALNLSNVAYVRLPTNAEGTRTRLRRGDVLVTITGANVTVSALVDHEIPEAYINQHIALLRPTLTEMSSFLLLWLQAEGAGKTQLTAAAYGAGKPGLNLDNIREVYIAIPPLEEAAELARRVAEALETYRSAVSVLEDQRFDAARLRQAILKSAFEGKLMPQDPSDEPASVMLKRLKDPQIKKRKQMNRSKKV